LDHSVSELSNAEIRSNLNEAQALAAHDGLLQVWQSLVEKSGR